MSKYIYMHTYTYLEPNVLLTQRKAYKYFCNFISLTLQIEYVLVFLDSLPLIVQVWLNGFIVSLFFGL